MKKHVLCLGLEFFKSGKELQAYPILSPALMQEAGQPPGDFEVISAGFHQAGRRA